MEQIDIVIPWVDDTDPEWKKERDQYLPENLRNKSSVSQYFRDWDTLRYVFRGVEKNMPWIRNIHFLTWGHLPDWLNINNPKIKIHRHSEFFIDPSVLPVFNSQAIEMNLHNISGLAEKFIYFNDDTLVVRPVGPERFFQNGMPVDYLVLDIPRGGWLYDHLRIKDPYTYVVRNNIKKLNTHFPFKILRKTHPNLFFHPSYTTLDKIRNRILTAIGEYKWIKVNHNPQGMLLSNLKQCFSLFEKEMLQTSKSRFRSFQDLNQYLYRDYALMSGKFVPEYFGDDFCIVLSSIDRYKNERSQYIKNNFICVNDSPFLKSEEYPELKKMVDEDLQKIFPEKSSFEI
ncbi:MAG: Stealth CR1 domain-containing protein [Muribaculaceae bacterium]|nr:Stealth CR1 domain-containing protein [Muribaculaceae bacterium]